MMRLAMVVVTIDVIGVLVMDNYGDDGVGDNDRVGDGVGDGTIATSFGDGDGEC